MFFLLFLLLAPHGAPAFQASAPVECADARACRQLALEAADRQDYERMHDLAWRAMQKSPRPVPELMYLLARAQALSGRPGDALVMLSRLADMKVPTDAPSNDDFKRVRALKGWPDLQARIEALTTSVAPPPAALNEGEASTLAVARTEGAKADAPKTTETPSTSVVEDALHFSPAGLVPRGLAYDGVSRRFLVADQRGRKLAVVDEFSSHVATLAGAQAGFGDVEAMEIDPREGNLWVVSDGSGVQTKLHKLQLISGRVLKSYDLPAEFGPSHIVDVAVGQDGAVLLLDATRGRVFRLTSAASLDTAAEVSNDGVASIAPAQPGTAFVAHAASIARVDLHAKVITALRVPDGLDLSGIARMRWNRGALVAIQKRGDRYRAIRVTLDAAERRVTGVEVLDPGFATLDPAAATVAGGTLYYLVDADGSDVTVKKIKLR